MRYYFIDANNLIMKIPRLSALFRRDKVAVREQLYFFIATKITGTHNKLCLFFDGFRQEGTKFPGASVYYSESRTADEVLKEHIEKAKNRALITVVSSDHQILNFAKVCTCQTITSEDFIRMVEAGNTTNEETNKIQNLQKDNDEFLRLFTQGD